MYDDILYKPAEKELMQGVETKQPLKAGALHASACTEAEKQAIFAGCPEKNPKDRIIYTLINTDRNRHMLEGIPHRGLMDLSVIYRFLMEDEKGGISSFVITERMAEKFQLTEEELYLAASKNTPVFLPASVIIAEPVGCVICNQRGVLGAAAILYEGVLSKVAFRMKSNLYILPSSVHEVIAVSAEKSRTEELKNAVAQVNRSVVKPCDFLSNQVYFFDRKSLKLKLAEDDRIS